MAEVTLATLAAQLSELMSRIDSVEQKLGSVERILGARIDAVEQKLGERIDAVERKLGEQVLAVERKLDAATGGGKLTLAFLSKQHDRSLREQAAMRAELRTHSAGLTRLDSSLQLVAGSVQGLTGEVRAQGERQQVQDKLWRNLEDRVFALEGS